MKGWKWVFNMALDVQGDSFDTKLVMWAILNGVLSQWMISRIGKLSRSLVMYRMRDSSCGYLVMLRKLLPEFLAYLPAEGMVTTD